MRSTRHSGDYGELDSCVPIQCLSGIVGTESMEVNKEIRAYKDFNSLWGNACSGGAVQRRGFLGCGDGEEGNVLSKVYEEKRVMGYVCSDIYILRSFLFFGFVVLCNVCGRSFYYC